MKALSPHFQQKALSKSHGRTTTSSCFFRKTWHQCSIDVLFDVPMPMTSTSWHDNGRNSSVLWSGTQNDRNDRNSVLKLEQFERIVWTCLNFVRLRPDLHLKEVTLCLQKPEINVHGYGQAMLYDFHKHENENQENIHCGVCLQCSRHVQCTVKGQSRSDSLLLSPYHWAKLFRGVVAIVAVPMRFAVICWIVLEAFVGQIHVFPLGSWMTIKVLGLSRISFLKSYREAVRLEKVQVSHHHKF